MESMDAEVRQVEIKNTSGKRKNFELLVYFEPQVETQQDYAAHQSFSKLFLKTEILGNAVIIRRRPRHGGEEKGIVFCCDTPVTYDTSKEQAMGRGGVRRIMETAGNEAKKTEGAVLDPCVLARVKLNIAPNEMKTVNFGMAPGSNLQETLSRLERSLLKKSQDFASRQESCSRALSLSKKDVSDTLDLYSAILFSKTSFDANAVLNSFMGQRDLWKFGISGELPIAVINVSSEEEAKKAGAWMKKHIFCFLNGAQFDLVLFTFDGGDYQRPVRSELLELLKLSGGESLIGVRGGIHFIEVLRLSEEEKNLLYSCASIVIDTDKEVPKKQVPPGSLFRMEPMKGAEGSVAKRFSDDGSFILECRKSLPALIQSHVLANRAFGYIATDCGAGHMWFQNSRENKINCWVNDPLAVSGPEQVLLHNKNKKYSVFASLNDNCTVTYSPGYAQYEKIVGQGIKLKTTVFIADKLPCRIIIAEAQGGDGSLIELSSGTTLIMGQNMPSVSHIVTGFDEQNEAVYAQNRYNTEYSPYFFAAMGSSKISYTGSYPAYKSGEFDMQTGAGLFPCLALRTAFEKRGDKYTAVIVHAAFGSLNALKTVRKLTKYEEAMKELETVTGKWKALSGKVQIDTKDTALDRYINNWAVYQTLDCRVFARTSFYQNGGAFGFRDQLQDVTALLYYCPDIAKQHILRSCAHQFLEGDVQHWWHYAKTPKHEGHKGVRTKCSDDLLWLPYALCEYIEKTSDTSILNFEIPYIESAPLDEYTNERYETPHISDTKESVLSHAYRAVDLALKRGNGAHNLPLIGTCDWNDGMNLIGVLGQGESVWLAWFLSLVLTKTAALCDKLGEKDRASRYRKKAEEYAAAAEAAWDSDHFLRAYYDDGEPVGAYSSMECKIDSISQSFSSLVPCDVKKCGEAVRSALRELFDRENKIILLFKPPFENSVKNPGYIKGYLPGVRENGGQYTHGAVWLAMSCFLTSMPDDGYEIVKAILPENHPQEVYKAEPFVIAGDVYYNPQHIGRGGWSYYTGASGWFLRVVLENMLGITIGDNTLTLNPSLPKQLEGYGAVLKRNKAVYRIEAKRIIRENAEKQAAQNDAKAFRLENDGEFELKIEI
ncbi:MAG: hypothetical protein Q8878_08305, partial [Bacillota bacterium]|nr:hypothetical protein [Bacillota bacterium]